MKIVISDTNIFIDLIEAGLLDAFFQLPFEVHTTTFIMEEILKEKQKDAIVKYLDNGQLQVTSFEDDEFMELLYLYNNAGSNLSVNDCSVWLLADKKHGALLTGDGNLRKKASQQGVEVRGILFIFDKLVEYSIISKAQAHDSLAFLASHNPRLPRNEVEKRLEMWK